MRVRCATTVCVCCVTFRRGPGRSEFLKKLQDNIMLNNKMITTLLEGVIMATL